MTRKTKLIISLFLSFLPLIFTEALASSSASCTMNGNWQHKATGSSQSCLSYVCCSKGNRTGWVAGTPKNAEDWCKSWRTTAVPDDSCSEETHEVFSRMTLLNMARLTNQAQEGDDDEDNQPPPLKFNAAMIMNVMANNEGSYQRGQQQSVSTCLTAVDT